MSSTTSTNGAAKKTSTDDGQAKTGLKIERVFSDCKVHPFDQIQWARRTAEIKDGEGGTVFRQEDCEFPESWSQLAVNVVASKYFYGDVQNGSGNPAEGKREFSIKQLVGRVADTIAYWGNEDGYFASYEDADCFGLELSWLLTNQYGAFNSPVWFNCGLWEAYGIEGDTVAWRWDAALNHTVPLFKGEAYKHPQISACMPYEVRVNTTAGLIPIGDIDRGMRNGLSYSTFDRDGNPTPIVKAICNGKRYVMRYKLADGTVLPMTSDHQVFVRTKDGIVQKSAGDMEIGKDELVLSRLNLLAGESAVRRGPLVITEDIAWLSGIMVGNGFSGRPQSANSETWEVKVNTVSERDRVQAVCDFNNVPYTAKEFHWGWLVRGYGAAAKSFWSALDLWEHTHDKVIPEWVMTAPSRIACAFMRGLFDTDGHASEQAGDRVYVGFSNVSGDVASKLQVLLRSVGIYSKLGGFQDSREDATRQYCWTVNICDQKSVDRFADLVGFTNENKLATILERRPTDDRDYRKDSVLVVGVDKGGASLVYDIQTGSSTFWAEGVLVHNCFIQSVDDTMDSIMDLAKAEAMLFKAGSGTGTDLSTLRSTKEKLAGGGKPSGPVSFFRVYDTIASIVKSGGKTRRAARMNTLLCDHPDIMEFVACKPKEDKKARALIAAGYSAGLTGDADEAYSSVAFQNTNISVRGTDEFMRKASGDDPDPTYWTKAVVDGRNVEQLNARDVLTELSQGTWECGDPGMQFASTINSWHTCSNTGKINSSNPCLRRGTRLLTKQGWKKVEELAALDSVDLFDGISFVQGEVWKTGIKPVIRLHANNGRTIDLTHDHQIHTENGWTEARSTIELKIPHVFPVVQFDGVNQLPKCITGGSGKFYSSAGVPIMETLGFLQGDGGIRDNSTVNVYYTPDKDGAFVRETVIPTLADIASDKGESYYPSPLSEGRNGFVFCRAKLHSWLKELGFDGAPLPERRLPSFLWRTTLKAQASFLRGLFGANGNILCDARDAVVLVSSCREMLQEVQLILQSMGIASAVRIHNKEQEIEWSNGSYVSKESYHLEITHYQDIIAFARKIGFPQECQVSKLGKITGVSLEPSTGSDSYRSKMTVVRVEELGIEDEVYDFRCKTTHAGLANGMVVHNCSEFVYLDDSSCNLASLNLLRFLDSDGNFDIKRFRAAVAIFITAQEILVDRGSYPTEKIARNSHDYRPLGLGYANLGALLMAMGLPYDSDEGRSFAGAITAIMQGAANNQSARIASFKGSFAGYAANQEPMTKVMTRHFQAAMDGREEGRNIDRGNQLGDLWDYAVDCWKYETIPHGQQHGYRNGQVTVIAPTGTIAFYMDCDTTGLEPDLALVKYKKLAGGGNLKITNQSVPSALKKLGYKPEAIASIVKHIEENDTIEGAAVLKDEHLPVFDCAFAPSQGNRSIHWKGHVKMMAAIQPFISGALSKSVNLPSDATVDGIRDAYILGWRLGLKAMAIYRDGSKGAQPLNTKKDTTEPSAAPVVVPRRERLPATRSAITHKFDVQGHEGYINVGFYPDGRAGELFVTMSKEGSTIGGLMDAWATAISLGLQYGVPLDVIVEKFAHSRFDPSGFTPNPDIRMAKSLTDYISRWLGMEFIAGYREANSPDRNYDEAAAQTPTPVVQKQPAKYQQDSPACSNCGAITVRAGSCYLCTACGTSSGCG